MRLKFLGLCPILSLLCAQFSFAMPDDLTQRDCVRTNSVSLETRGRNSERESVALNLVPNNAAMIAEMIPETAENALVPVRNPHEYSNMVEWMVECGINVNMMNNLGWNPIHVAALYGNEHIIKWLVDHGEDVNSLTNAGRTPLMIVSERGHSKIVKLLVKNGADVNVRADNGLTSLMGAAFYGRYSVVEYLINRGADISTRAKDGSTAPQLAALRQHWEIVDFLKGRTVNKEEIISPFGIILPVAE